MNPARLLAHFDRISDAPDAVPRLRRFILDLAVRGKLVEQDAKDEPAAGFRVPEFVDGKDRLEIVLPPRWSWARVADVAEARLGKMLDRAKNSGKLYTYLRNTNVQWFEITTDDLKTMPIEDEEIGKFLLRDRDILICEGGHPGRAAVWRGQTPDMAFQKALHRVRSMSSLNSDYFVFCLAVYFRASVLENYYTGVGIPHLTGVSLSKLVFPLPPIAEQHRIVAKVDELMALCDRLEAAQKERENQRDRLMGASLARLNNDADAFRGHARFHLCHLPRLTTRPDQIPTLRQTILNFAVLGKLVSQDPKDEPASILLKRIKPLEKPARYASRSVELIVGNCGLSVGDPKTPLPAGWLRAPMVEIARLESGHTPSRNRPDWWGGDIPWIGLVDARVHHGREIAETIQHTNPEGIANSAARVLPAGTVCFSRTASVGYVVVMARPMATSQDFVNWVPTEAVSSRWLQLVLIAEKPALPRFSKGAVHQTIYYPAWLSMHISIPPLAEQHRIVAKVEELMALCDRLETQLTAAQTDSRRLLEAVLHEALATAG